MLLKRSGKWGAAWENLFMPYVNNKGADQPLLFTAYIQVFSWRGSNILLVFIEITSQSQVFISITMRLLPSLPVLLTEPTIKYHTCKSGCWPSWSRAVPARLTGNKNSIIYRYCSVKSCSPWLTATLDSTDSVDSTSRNNGIALISPWRKPLCTWKYLKRLSYHLQAVFIKQSTKLDLAIPWENLPSELWNYVLKTQTGLLS